MRSDPHGLTLSPSDLNAFVACRHKTGLDLRAARGELARSGPRRPDAELLQKRGLEHEAAVRDRLIAEGRTVVDVVAPGANPFEDVPGALVATEQAMRDGADVVYQGAFRDVHDGVRWQGFADFLVRVPGETALGPWGYEAWDTKLARHPKPYFALQLAFYSEQIGRLQGVAPTAMHVVLGDGTTRAIRVDDVADYYARLCAELADYLREPQAEPYPYRVDACDYCEWWGRCRDRRRRDDDTSLVAFLGRDQSIRLDADGVHTVVDVAAIPPDRPVRKVARDTIASLRAQARLQVASRASGQPRHEFLPLEEGRGFFRLPSPSPGDVFFDIEGDPYWSLADDPLEYLLGTVTLARDGATPYATRWAHSRAEERVAFEALIDDLTARRAADPGLHVYHYNHYETTAVKRLMGRYGTREHEVDELLRGEVFVDLYSIVRQALRVGEESYSIKRLERHYGFVRDEEAMDAGGSMVAYTTWTHTRDDAILESIATYNADDCRSLIGLRDWLLALRPDAEREFDTVLPDRAAVERRPVTEQRQGELDEIARLRGALEAGLPEDEDARSPDERARQLAADALDYHSREAKPAWWAYFARLEKTDGQLRDEDSEAIGGLTEHPTLVAEPILRSLKIPMAFPAQQHKLGRGTVTDPAPEKPKSVEIVELDDGTGVLWIKRGANELSPLPRALIPGGPPLTTAHAAALRRLAGRVLDDGLEPSGRLDASVDLLMRRAPRLRGAALGDPLADVVDALDASALVVQGPPGSGKTTRGAEMIVELLARGRRVGVTATSHKVIHHLLECVEAVAEREGVNFRGWKRGDKKDPNTGYDTPCFETRADNADFESLPDDVRLIAGTSWLFARDGLREAVDVLVVDEAGQVALADALAVAQAARSVVLLGDPQQLPHVAQGTHPRGSGASVLTHMLDGTATIPSDRGVFLERSFRMHPDITRFVSRTSYDGRLESAPECTEQRVTSPGLRGTGLRFLPVEHDGNGQQSPEEARQIADEIARLLDGGTCVEKRVERPLVLDDILVVAAYNAQVRRLQAALPPGARVGTVDKFQGQQGQVVFFSMASSTGEDIPRGLEFLFSINRLNVAISRARALAAVVCSPKLLTTACHTIDQIPLVNALCRFASWAS